MRIEQYFLMTDYSLWEVILNGDSHVPTRVIEGVLQPVSPTTAEQKLARKNELKAHGTLLMALPDKHQLKFNSHKDAKTLMKAIEKRFRGNTETKKVQKTLLKQQYKNFTGSNSESLDQIHDRMQKLTHTLIWRNKADLEEQSLDNLFSSLKIYKAEVKHSSSTGTTTQNLAFMSLSNTDSTTEYVNDATNVLAVCAKMPVSSFPNVDFLSNAGIYLFFTSQSTSPQLVNEDLKQIDKTGRNLRANGPTSMGFDMSKVESYNSHGKGNFARECRSPKDSRRNGTAEPQKRTVPLRDNALVTLRRKLEKAEHERDDLKLKLEKFQTSSKNLTDLLASQTNEKTGLGYNSQVFTRDMFDCDDYLSSESDESWPPSSLYNRFQPNDGYHAVPPPYTGTFMPPKPDLVFNIAPTAVETDHSPFTVQLSPTKPEQALSYTNRPTTHIIEDWVSDFEDESETKASQIVPSFVQSSEQVKSPRHSVQHVETSIPAANPKTTSPKPASSGKRRNRKACFVCKILTQSKPVSITDVRPVSAVVPKIKVTRPRHANSIVTMSKSPIRRHLTRSTSPMTNNSPLRVTAVKALVISAAQENKLSLKVKVIRSDNGTEFKNSDLNQFCGMKGIKREFSVPRTPQQNGIAERKNRTLIEAARTMLADSLLPIPFWARFLEKEKLRQVEVVNTGCYVQNRVLVTKPYNKTLYELLHGRTLSIGFMRPFGYLVTILNTLDSLENFNGKVDEGFLAGYSNNDEDAAFNRKEHDFDVKKPESEVSVSPSSSAQSKKQDDKTKKETRGKSPVESFIGYKDLSAEFEDCSDNSINEVNAADDIIFAATNKDLCKSFEKMMKDKFQMSSMGELTFFLGLQVKQKKDGIFISQDKYVAKILRKFGLIEGKSSSTPIDTEKPLLKDPDGEDVDVHTYRSMIGSLMYLTSSRPDIMFAVNDVTRLQALVYKKKIVVTEAIIREALHLDDAEGVDCLPNEEFFFRCMSAKRTSWNEFSSLMASAVICLSSEKGFSGVETPFFEGMLVEQEIDEEGDADAHVEEVDTCDAAHGDVGAARGEVPTVTEEPSIPSPTPPTLPPQLPQGIPSTSQVQQTPPQLPQRVETSDDTVMDDESNHGRMIAEMDQDDVIVLKDDKEEDKEVADAVKDVKEAKVDESAQDQERQAESQAKIYKIDMDHANKVLSMQEDETEPAEVQEVVDVVTTAKLITEVVTAASETVTAASAIINTAKAQVPAATLTAAPARIAAAPSKRRKGVVIRDPELESTISTIIPAETKSKDKGKGILVEEPKPLKKKQQIELYEQYGRELHAELNKDIDWDEAINHVKRKSKEDHAVKRYQVLKRKPQTEAQARKNIIMYLKNVVGFKMDYFKGMSYDDIRPIFEDKLNLNIITFTSTQLILLVERKYSLTRFTLDQMLNAVRLKVEEEGEVSLELLRSRVSEGVSTQIEAISASDVDTMWNTLANIIKDATKDSLGMAIGTSKIHTARKESWWLYEEVQSKVKRKGLESYFCVGRVIKMSGLERRRECWPITKALANRIEVAVLRMIRWTCGKTMLDIIQNEVYRAELEMESIINKMKEGRLRWFGHVRRRPQSAPVRRVEALVVDGMRRRGRPKLRWEDRVKLDMKKLLLSEDMTSDKNE
uniref:Ribonuclease H-like domain-containing protein n=1 Tax=Tanacetum cinerariifolium TaxID=118510 RepID=A0A6L2JM75_TANCI|nr:ribonuclease H-like domain-containing protein [Tanacetum cinerariifolium]